MDRKYQKPDDIYDDEDTFIHYEDVEVNDREQKELEEKQTDCCVAYLDILGFKKMIDKDSHLPVFALRFIKRFIDLFCRSTNQYYENAKTRDDIYDEFLPKATMFSDSIVISQPITELNYPLFIDLIAQLQYSLFTKGILIRGGISYGKLYHDENYLFGKGLIKAYLFESEYADYPRILVDNDLIEEIHRIVDARFEQSWNDYVIVDGERHYLYNGLDDDEGDYSCYVGKDFDDKMYINYFYKIIEYGFLSASIKGNETDLENLISEPEFINAKNIIETGLKTTDHRILTKYEWLRKLYNNSISTAFVKRGIKKANDALSKLLIQ